MKINSVRSLPDSRHEVPGLSDADQMNGCRAQRVTHTHTSFNLFTANRRIGQKRGDAIRHADVDNIIIIIASN